MRIAIVLVLAVVGCGSTGEVGEAPPVADAGPAVSVIVRPECIETDESIRTCMRANGPGAWTAPASCLGADINPATPQKRTAEGGVVERDGRKCCGFVNVDGATALCCADLSTCLGE